MFTIPPKKMIILNILDILRKYSDADHTLSAKEIGDWLEKEHSQKVDRKAIKRNLLNLIDFGYDINYTETKRISKNGEVEIIHSDWYLNREFEDAELRLLIDSLLFSKHIPYNQCKELIEKLEKLSNDYFKVRVKHIRTMPEKLPENKELFLTIEILDEAISKKKQVSFQYNDYGTDKKKHPRTNADGSPKTYTVSPYQMAATNGRYYLISNSHGHDNISNYRVDRISAIQMLKEPAKPMKEVKGMEKGWNLPKHMAENIYMFSGDSAFVKFRAKRSAVSDVLDWFGLDARFTDDSGGGGSGDTVLVDVRVNEQAMVYWALQYGQQVEVLEPAALRERIGDAAKAIAKKYGK